jgi:cytoskeletal protein RodZ
MDEELVETGGPSVGERLRVAREEKKMSLEDIAAQTRIPQRHLESIERSEWDKLPAPTYTIGFARSYATCVGLDRTDISDQLRIELGGSRPTMTAPEVFEPADPARTMPKALVFGAIAAVILLVLVMTWLNKRSLEPGDESTTNAPAVAPAATQPGAPPPAATSTQQPVVLSAIDPVWLQVSEKGGATLFAGMLQPGQTYAVPTTAVAPVLKTGKPEALRVTVGTSVAPAVGPAATTINDVSLLPADLLKAGQTSVATPPAAPPAPPPRANAAQPRRTTAAPAPSPSSPPADPAPAPTNTTTGQ